MTDPEAFDAWLAANGEPNWTDPRRSHDSRRQPIVIQADGYAWH